MRQVNTIKTIAFLVAITIALFWGWSLWGNDIETFVENKMNLSKNKILGNSQDLIYFSVKPNQTVSGVFTVSGSVKNSYFFEGNILINILTLEEESLRNGNGNAKTNWMTSEPVEFEAELDLRNLPKGKAYIEIRNDNPAGPDEGINKNILVPIIIN